MSGHFLPVTDFFTIGKASRSHGTAGQLRIIADDAYKSYFRENEFLFFDHDGSMVPYQITLAEEGQHFVIALQGIVNKDQSDALSGRDIWISLDRVLPHHLNSPKIMRDAWDTYQLLDVRTEEKFPILRTEEFPQQLMAVVRKEGKEVYVPLHEKLIKNIDRKNHVIAMDIPDGLFDL